MFIDINCLLIENKYAEPRVATPVFSMKKRAFPMRDLAKKPL